MLLNSIHITDSSSTLYLIFIRCLSTLKTFLCGQEKHFFVLFHSPKTSELKINGWGKDVMK